MNAIAAPTEDLFDLDLELIEETAAPGHDRCLNTAQQSGCGPTLEVDPPPAPQAQTTVCWKTYACL